jgi:UPF0176 protein
MIMTYHIAAFYQFLPLPNWEALKVPLLELCHAHSMKGTILLASEGVNGTIAAPTKALLTNFMTHFIEKGPLEGRLNNLELKYSECEDEPFQRMKVRLKKEIVTMGQAQIDPLKMVGTYVAPEDWNDLIADPEVLVIDTRNIYETDLGVFQGALDPATNNFRDFPDFVRKQLDPKRHKKIAMYCTGGIRCEKASNFMLTQGFDEVYHLKGGILNYFEKVPQEKSLWQGECFVFDERIAVDHALKPSSIRDNPKDMRFEQRNTVQS